MPAKAKGKSSASQLRRDIEYATFRVLADADSLDEAAPRSSAGSARRSDGITARSGPWTRQAKSSDASRHITPRAHLAVRRPQPAHHARARPRASRSCLGVRRARLGSGHPDRPELPAREGRGGSGSPRRARRSRSPSATPSSAPSSSSARTCTNRTRRCSTCSQRSDGGSVCSSSGSRWKLSSTSRKHSSNTKESPPSTGSA